MNGTNTDFSIALSGLRIQAYIHGVDPNTEEMRKFLNQTAEVIATERSMVREYETIINNPRGNK